VQIVRTERNATLVRGPDIAEPATQWLRHGADVFSVSRRLGHASAAFTMDV
jgi:hypothetical protein